MSTRSGRIRSSDIAANPSQRRPSRSPARVRKSSPATPARKSPPTRQSGRKSPARKSPSRKTSSPSRKTQSQYPARKSPARVSTRESKEPEPVAPAPPKSPIKRPAISSDVAVRLEKLDTFRSTRSKRIEYSVKDITSTQSDYTLEKLNGIEPITDIYGLRHRKSVEEITPRRSSRLRDIIDTVPIGDIRRSISKSRSLSKSISKSVSKSIDAYSDEENSAEEFVREKSKSITRKLSTPLRNSISNMNQIASRYEFGGRVGSAALIFLIPLSVVSILTSCLKSCSFNTLINFSPFKSLGLWFSIPTTIIITTQIILQGILAIVPIFGKCAERMDGSERKQCFNALFASIVTASIIYGLDFSKIINKDAILGDYLKLATASYIFAVVLSIGLFVKSRKANKNDLNVFGNTGYFLYDFFMGRELHPQIGKLDVKIWISRICNINTLILSTLIFTQGIKLHLKEDENLDLTNYEELQNKITIQPTILVFSMLQITYIMSYIVKEHRITSTFYWQSEGVGYLQTVSSSLYPFYFTILSKYVADTNLMLSTKTLIFASGLYAVGLIIMQVSNHIKYEFRKNPLQPSLAKLESMPTFHGNKLLISGPWGILRHPNYAGDIIVHIALSLPGVLTGEVIAASPALITVLVLLHRAWRDHARCSKRYGAAWQRYCKKVPSVIIPKLL